MNRDPRLLAAAIVSGILVWGVAGCAPKKCTPLSPFYFNGTRIFPVVCQRDHIEKACRFHPRTGLTVDACCHKRGKKCWIMQADDEAGMKAAHHEYAHCAGYDEGGARCDDWPGTVPPSGQECKDGWRRRDMSKEGFPK